MPLAAISAATASGAVRSTSVSRAPSAAKSAALARPIAPQAPVINTLRSLSRMASSPSSRTIPGLLARRSKPTGIGDATDPRGSTGAERLDYPRARHARK